MSEKNSHYSTCLFGEPITDKICNKYDIYFKLACSSPLDDFFIGFATSVDDIKNWDNALGYGDNKKYSVGINIQLMEDKFVLDDATFTYKSLDWRSKSMFESSDVFGLSFDFIHDEYQIYYNDIKADKLSLKGKKTIIPGISLSAQNDSVQVLRQISLINLSRKNCSFHQ